MNDLNLSKGISDSVGKAIAFIWKEAELLDKKDYAGWEAMWDEDGRYVVPISHETIDFAATLNYAYDDGRMRKMRIERLTSGVSMSTIDAAATVRSVSRFVPTYVAADLVEINSSQLVVGYKRQKQSFFIADLTHRVRFGPQGPKLEQKVIRLINSEDSIHSLGFLL